MLNVPYSINPCGHGAVHANWPMVADRRTPYCSNASRGPVRLLPFALMPLKPPMRNIPKCCDLAVENFTPKMHFHE